MTAIIIASIPIIYFVFVGFSKKLKKINTEILNNNDNYFSHINETFTMIREIRSLGLEKIRSDKFSNLIDIIKLKRIKIAVFSSLSGKISGFVNVITNILVIISGSYLLYNGTLKMEYFIAFFSYSGQFTESIFNITELNIRIQQTLASLRRVFDLIDDITFENNEGGSEEIKEADGVIEFEKVDFSYNEESLILKNVSFSVESNSKTAIIGRNGAGKSTILSLIQRFYRPCSGVIRLDGTDIQSLKLESLRSHISVVNQEPFFFNDTVLNNTLRTRASESVHALRPGVERKAGRAPLQRRHARQSASPHWPR
jgi:ATP-binding cassette subfamily B protein